MSASLKSQLDLLAELCPLGYATGLHVRFTSPTYLFQTYPEAWNEHYSANGLVMQDPTVAWGFGNGGWRRWSDLVDEDVAGVLAKAADYGLIFGAALSVLSDGSRSIGGVARRDREYTDAELDRALAIFSQMHALTADEAAISAEDRATIEAYSITV
ncbi:MAG: autoinducer binding domain-containing protein [Pseudomonadota bacterium]